MRGRLRESKGQIEREKRKRQKQLKSEIDGEIYYDILTIENEIYCETQYEIYIKRYSREAGERLRDRKEKQRD